MLIVFNSITISIINNIIIFIHNSTIFKVIIIIYKILFLTLLYLKVDSLFITHFHISIYNSTRFKVAVIICNFTISNITILKDNYFVFIQ